MFATKSASSAAMKTVVVFVVVVVVAFLRSSPSSLLFFFFHARARLLHQRVRERLRRASLPHIVAAVLRHDRLQALLRDVREGRARGHQTRLRKLRVQPSADVRGHELVVRLTTRKMKTKTSVSRVMSARLVERRSHASKREEEEGPSGA